MIINCSRAKTALHCWRKTFNNYHRNLEGPRSMNLVDGGAFHEALAVGLATPTDHNWERALVEARVKFDEGVAASAIPEEQSYLVDQHWQVVRQMALLYKENFAAEDYTIIQPECLFDVPLPNTHHNDITLHWFEITDDGVAERFGMPTPEAILSKRVISPHCLHDPSDADQQCFCWQPHRLVGKTDAVVRWKGNLWLLEHKTSAIKGAQFWDQWEIEIQPTTYIYGIWKALGIRPRGFVVDMIYKPSENQIATWNAKRVGSAVRPLTDYMTYERQAFMRTEEDLTAVEAQYIDLCNEWEERILHGRFGMHNVQGICKLYNRKCDYWMACITHDDTHELAALGTRKPDYVVEKSLRLLPTGENE